MIGEGGIYDAAEFAAELAIAKTLGKTKEQHPDFSDAQLMAQAFPEYEADVDDNGNATIKFDVRLKRFPMERSILQNLMNAARRGDAIDPATVQLLNSLKLAFATLLLSSTASALRTLGLDPYSLTPSTRAQYQGSINPLK